MHNDIIYTESHRGKRWKTLEKQWFAHRIVMRSHNTVEYNQNLIKPYKTSISASRDNGT